MKGRGNANHFNITYLIIFISKVRVYAREREKQKRERKEGREGKKREGKRREEKRKEKKKKKQVLFPTTCQWNGPWKQRTKCGLILSGF